MKKRLWEIFYIVCLWLLILGAILIKVIGDGKQGPEIAQKEDVKAEIVVADKKEESKIEAPKPAVSPQPEVRKSLVIRSPKLGWLRVRKAPNTTSPEVARVQDGAVVVSTGSKQGWYEIILDDNKKGWVLGSYVSRAETQKFSPEKKIEAEKVEKKVEEEKTEKANLGQEKVQVNSPKLGWLRVRALPGPQGHEVGRVNHGKTFVVQARQSDWVQIEYASGKKGWVSGDYVKALP